MNAKKIMGTVLVALLAAALFVGAASAVGDVDGDTVFFFEKLNQDYYGTWNNGANSFTIAAGADYVSNTALPEGKYNYNDSVAIYLKKPTAAISGVTTPAATGYQIIGGTIYQNDVATVNLVSAATNTNMKIVKVLLIGSDNVPTVIYEEAVATATNKASINFNSALYTTGEYKLQAIFDGAFADGTYVDQKYSGVLGTITVAKENDVEITAAAESFTQGDSFEVTITGKPGIMVNLTAENLAIKLGALDPVDVNTWNIKIPNTGKAVVYAVAGSETGSGKIYVKEYDGTTVGDLLETLTVKVTAGTITATTDKDSYYIGNDVVLSGTSTAGSTLFAYIAGTNKDMAVLNNGQSFSVSNGKWELEIDGDDIRDMKLDAGTYTVYITSAALPTPAVSELKNVAYTTASLVLKQPFISITEAPAVAVQNTDYLVTGTAEATGEVKYYVFGTNFFDQGTASVEKGEFEIEMPIVDMAAGQYFMVVQHKMYDNQYNIQITDTEPYPVYLYDSNGKQIGASLFNVTDRQKTNAAQAFVDELAGQNIDDMYVKLSFVVAAQESVINPIPAEVTKGSKLTVSGSTNVGEGETVTVEMISTAFAAQPKETVGSASFISLVTKTDENGNWEITFDTTGLNVDEYTVTAAVGTLNKATAKVNVIEGAPTEQPTTTPTEQPTQTEQPTETPVQTPGFGALAALAGLGAVAVLLLRRE